MPHKSKVSVHRRIDIGTCVYRPDHQIIGISYLSYKLQIFTYGNHVQCVYDQYICKCVRISSFVYQQSHITWVNKSLHSFYPQKLGNIKP